MQTRLGIDLGGANLMVSTPTAGIIYRAPSMIAQERDTNRIVAVGNQAEQKLNLREPSLYYSRPFAKGLTANPQITEAVISSCLLAAGGYPGQTDVLLSIPCDLSDSQEEMLQSMAVRAGARRCHLVYAPLAALAGSFLNVPKACLAVDIGAAATRVMLLCRGRIYYMKSVPIGGQALDRAIAEYIAKKRKIKISLRTAEDAKIAVGTTYGDMPLKYMDATGRDAADRPVSFQISTRDFYDAVEEPFGAMLEAIWVAVTKIPSECTREVFELGIQLTGGGALLDGLDKAVAGITGVPTRRVDESMSCVALGLGEILSRLPEDIPPAYRNVSEIFIKQIYSAKQEKADL